MEEKKIVKAISFQYRTITLVNLLLKKLFCVKYKTQHQLNSTREK